MIIGIILQCLGIKVSLDIWKSNETLRFGSFVSSLFLLEIVKRNTSGKGIQNLSLGFFVTLNL